VACPALLPLFTTLLSLPPTPPLLKVYSNEGHPTESTPEFQTYADHCINAPREGGGGDEEEELKKVRTLV